MKSATPAEETPQHARISRAPRGGRTSTQGQHKGNPMKSFRQGDVLVVLVSDTAIPSGAKPVKGEVILAFGEVTGHCHRIVEKKKARYFDANAERFLQIIEKTALSHEEHTAIVLDKGVYKQAFQVEEQGEEVRRVAD